MTGGSYPLNPGFGGDEAMKEYDEKRLLQVPLVYEYIQENRASNYETPWSEWLVATQSAD
jgi:hypothetical protein